jgi:hypothetical protein
MRQQFPKKETSQGKSFLEWKCGHTRPNSRTQMNKQEMVSYPVTEPMRQLALQALRTTGKTQTDLAKATGNGKPWVTKFLGGSMRTIKEKDILAIQEVLKIDFFHVEKAGGERSPLAAKIAGLVDTDPAFAKLASALEVALTEARGAFTPRYIPTKDMTKLGQEIIKLAFANEDKPGKVAREVLKMLA